MKRISFSRISEWSVLALLVISILWRGGKGLEVTWLAAIVAGLITLVYAVKRLLGISTIDTTNPQAVSRNNTEVPFVLWGMVLAVIFLTIISYVHSTTRNYGLDVVLRNTSFSLIFFWTVRTALDGKQNRLLSLTIRIVTWTAIIATLIGIAVYILQPVNRFVGTFFDFRFDTDYWPNAWAEFTLIAWPLMTIQWARTTNIRLRRLILVCIALVIGSLLLSYSRGGGLAFILQIGLMLLLFAYLGFRDIRYRRIFKSVRNAMVVRTVVIGIIATALFFGINAVRSHYYDVQSVGAKITFTASEGTSSIDERSQFWHQAFVLSWEHPWLGFGPYSFRFVQPKLAEGVLATADHAHNAILNNAMERGWPIAILSLLIILYVLWMSLRNLLTVRREWSQEKDITTVMLLIAVIGVYAHNMIDYNLQFVGIALPFWLCLGFLVVPPTSKSQSALASFGRWKLSQYLFRLKVLVACSLLLVTAVEGSELVLSSLGRHAEANGNIDEALHWYGLAEHQWFSRDMYLSKAQLLLQKNDPEAALQAIDVYMKVNAADARAWKLRGQIFLRMQEYLPAEQALEKAYELGKYTDLDILDSLLQTSRDPKAKEDLLSRKLEFDSMFSAYADAIEHDVHFIDLSTNVESLQSVSRQLSQLFPTDENRYKQISRHAVAHAQEERTMYSARSLGKLW